MHQPEPLAPLRVLLVDDSPLFLRGLEALLADEPTIEVVGTATDGAAALSAAGRLRPDAILMDVHMPVLGGVSAASTLEQELPGVAVILLSGLWRPAGRRDLPTGVHAVLSKAASLSEIVDTIHSAAAGRRAPAAARSSRQSVGSDRLTGREIQILSMLAKGYHSARIAGELELKQKTVRNYISVIYDKIGVHGRSGAVLHAVRTGLLDEIG